MQNTPPEQKPKWPSVKDILVFAGLVVAFLALIICAANLELNKPLKFIICASIIILLAAFCWLAYQKTESVVSICIVVICGVLIIIIGLGINSFEDYLKWLNSTGKEYIEGKLKPSDKKDSVGQSREN